MPIQSSFRRAAAAPLLITWLLAAWAASACDQDFVDRGVLSDPEASVVVVSGSNQAGPMGFFLRRALRVQVRDARGNPIPGQRVDFRQLVGQGELSADFGVTDHAGITQVLFAPLSEGSQIVEAQQTGAAARATFQLQGFDATREIKPGSLEKVGGDNQRGTVGTLLPQPLTVRVTNLNGAPLANFPVVFTATTDATLLGTANEGDLTEIDSLGNPVSPGPFPEAPDTTFGLQVVAFTDGNGIADVIVRLATRPGDNIVTAALVSSSGTVEVTSFTLTGELGSTFNATALVKVGGDDQQVTIDTVGAGGDFQADDFEAILVRLNDRFGNPVRNGEVRFRVIGGVATVLSPVVLTDADGFASTVVRPGQNFVGVIRVAALSSGIAFDPSQHVFTLTVGLPDEATPADTTGG